MKHLPPIPETIKAAGKKSELTGNTLLPLFDTERLLFLEKGTVYIFYIDREEGNPIGERSLVTSFEAPALIPSICVPHWQGKGHLYALTDGNVTLYDLPFEQYPTLPQDYLEQSIENWIFKVENFFEKDLQIKVDLSFNAGDEAPFQKDQTLSPYKEHDPNKVHSILWVETEKGKWTVGSEEPLHFFAPPYLFPLKQHAFLKAVEEGYVKTHSTKTILEKKLLAHGLFHLNAHLLDHLLKQREKTQKNDSERIEKREKLSKKLLDHSLREMSAVLNPMPTTIPILATDELTIAFRHVLEAMHLDFAVQEEGLEESDTRLKIDELCNKAHVRFRMLRLREHWWKSDARHMLGFLGEEKKPIAIIREKDHYYYSLPGSSQKVRINEKIASQIDSTTFMFYRPFEEGKRKALQIFKTFFKSHRSAFVNLVIYGLISTFIALFPPIATNFLFSTIIPDASLSLLFQLGIGLFLAALGSAIFSYFESLSAMRLEGLADLFVQSAMWDHLLKIPMKFFRGYSIGDLIRRVMAITEMHKLITGSVMRTLLTGVFSLMYLIVMFYFDPILSIVGLLTISFGAVISLICAISKMRIERELYALEGKMNSSIIQIIGGVSKLRISGAENHAFSYWGDLFGKFQKSRMRAQIRLIIALVSNHSLSILSTLLIFAFAMVSIDHKDSKDLGNFLAFFTAFGTFSAAFFSMSNTAVTLISAIPLWERSKVVTEVEPERKQEDIIRPKLQGKVSLDDIDFRYEEKLPLTLKKVSLVANPGELIGIIGPSGSGKSTLVRMLLGFENPEKGGVYYDEKDLSLLDVNHVRKQIGVVLQEKGIISGTFYENIVCGGMFSMDEVHRALKLSRFDKDLELFPMGLHTFITGGGETLSGGQRQRLMIARALIANPKILIFDEATSALDNLTQDEVSKNLEELNVTRIVIAHRLSTIRNADRIYLLKDGEMQGVGTFEELKESSELFRSMLNRQIL